MNIDGVYVEDLQKDTLLYAGRIKVNITDWFFLKDKIELKYIGLEDATIHLNRVDSVWNYQYLVDFFATPSSSKKNKPVALSLGELSLKNIHIKNRDEWIGEDKEFDVKELRLVAEEVNLAEKRISISSLKLDEPVFFLNDYTGRRPGNAPRIKTKENKNRELLNKDGWRLQVKEISLHNGVFKRDGEINRKTYNYFDDSRIHFYAINGTLKNVSVVQDTVFAKIDLGTKERSGFTVNSIKSTFRMQPDAMIFDSLDILTPFSHLTHYYAMRYDDFNEDMKDFLSKVKLEGRFKNSRLHSRDIAFFAPELKNWNIQIKLNGEVNGTVDNIGAKNFTIESGKQTFLNGDIHLTGLPDVNSTQVHFKANTLRTTYDDVSAMFPDIKKISDPRLSELRQVSFHGGFNGHLRNFITQGTIHSNLGAVTSNLRMKFPVRGVPVYSGEVSTDQFDMGTFLGVEKLGAISFKGNVSGSGFTAHTLNAHLNGVFPYIQFNGYGYEQTTVHGLMDKRLFHGTVAVNDPNVIIGLDGEIDFNPDRPEFNFFAEIQRSNLKKMGFTDDDVNVIGKFDMNFNGDDIDNFLGNVSLYDVAITKANQTYVLDTLTLSSQLMDKQKMLQLRNTEASAYLLGDFSIRELPDAVKKFLNKYYPRYISPPRREIQNQTFLFQLDVKNIDQYMPLFNANLKGFNNSTIVGSLNSASNLMAISMIIPYAGYNNMEVHEFKFTGVGNMDSLKVSSVVGNTVINDSLQFPGTRISIASSNNVSQLNITTAATQTINDASLSAQITGLPDGVEIHFDESSIVLNEKTWRIDGGGELTLSRSHIHAQDINLSNGDQKISLVSKHSDVGTWDDIIVDINRVNIGDFMPFVLNDPRMEGVVSGNIIIEDAFRDMYISSELKAEQFRLENDSIGEIQIMAAWDGTNKNAKFEAISDNKNYKFSVAGSYDMSDSLHQQINANANFDYTNIHFLEKYLSTVFDNMTGFATGNLRMQGDINRPDYVGEIDVRDAGLKVAYTQCYYTIDSARITFTPGKIDFGSITLHDTLTQNGKSEHNTAELTGNLQHKNFSDFVYNIAINTNRLLVLNTTKADNDMFYGKAIGKANFRFRGPEDDMRMTITGEPVDSSSIYITSSSSKERGSEDYIVWKQYGREMDIHGTGGNESQLNIDLNLTANNYVRMYMVLDETTGDIIEANGNGMLKMHTGSNSPFTINGKYTIDRGYYRFSFQEIFKKPFTLLPNEGSYIRWDGDPYMAEINIKAKYQANDVKLSSLYADQGQSSDPELSRLKSERTDIDVLCTLQGLLNKPDIHFDIAVAANSDVKNNQRLLSDLQRINNDDNEKNKQVAYLIVFRSFAPIGQYNVLQADATTFAFNTLSEFFSGYLTSSLKSILFDIFKDPSLNVNFNYTRASIDPTGTSTGNTVNFTRDNISLQFIKSLLNDKLVITFGSDFNFVSSGSPSVLNNEGTNFLFLPDITAEYKITPDGKFRVSCFYRSNFDVLSVNGKRNRAGGSISFRTEFDSERIRRKKQAAIRKEEDNRRDSTAVSLK